MVSLLGLILLLSGNWILPLMDRDEPRFAEASREMLQRHDWVIPTLNGEYRFDKPPLIYWCQILSYKTLGENPFAARLPSVLFTTATALLLVLWGRRIGNPRAGFYAGLMFLTCLQILVHGRLSVADMPMVFFVALGTWTGWELSRPDCSNRTRWWWAFYLSLAFGFLAKGPEAWLPLGGLIIGKIRNPKEFRLPVWNTVLGLVLATGLVGIWGIPALMQTHGEFAKIGLGKHVVQRSVGVVNGHGLGGLGGYLGAMPLYFLTFFLSFAPWAWKFPAALRRWWGTRENDLFGSYLFIQALLIFVVFSIVRTKLPHYTLPAFPLLALWLARQMTGEPAAKSADAVQSVWVRFIESLDRRVKIGGGLTSMCLVAFAITLVGFSLAAPHIMTRRLWNAVEPHACPEMRVASVDFGEDSLCWEFRKRVTNMIEHVSIGKAEAYLQGPPPRVLVVPTAQFESRIKTIPTNAITLRVTGFDTTYLKKWDMTAVIVK